VRRRTDGAPLLRAAGVAVVALAAATALAQPAAPGGSPPRVAIPAHNAASLTTPPPRPPVGDAADKARTLFAAIVADDPARARDFFFPRDAFVVLKAIANPGAYWDRLFRRYEQDIHTLHARTPDLARGTFDRLEIVRRGGWTRVREEANALPYWVSRHSWLHYRVGAQDRRLEVRVLITWDDRWYVTHLSEFH